MPCGRVEVYIFLNAAATAPQHFYLRLIAFKDKGFEFGTAAPPLQTKNSKFKKKAKFPKKAAKSAKLYIIEARYQAAAKKSQSPYNEGKSPPKKNSV